MYASIIGYGELGKQFKTLLNYKYNSNFLYFDDEYHKIEDCTSFKFDSFINEEFKNSDFYISLGYKHLQTKHAIILKLIELKRKIPLLSIQLVLSMTVLRLTMQL